MTDNSNQDAEWTDMEASKDTGVPAASDDPSQAKGEGTPDQETTTPQEEGDSAPEKAEQPQEDKTAEEPSKSVEEVDEERKRQAKIGRQKGEIASNALRAILDDDNAKSILESNDILLKEAKRKYPEAVEDLFKEEEAPEEVETTEEAPAAEENTLAKLTLAAIKNERSATAKSFGADNGLNEDEIKRLSNIAEGMVQADSSLLFEDALGAASSIISGKSPDGSPSLPTNSDKSQPAKQQVDGKRVEFWTKQGYDKKKTEKVLKRADAIAKQFTGSDDWISMETPEEPTTKRDF